MEKLKRYIIFLIGLFISSLGVSFVTKANLGTSPISSIPYVLSLSFSLTLGQFTILFSLLLIVLQLIILRKNFKPEHYFSSVIYLLAGCVILGFGVYIEVLADVAMLPGESFVRAVSSTWNTDFGITKVIFDISMTLIAGILSFAFAHQLNGVREGTVIAAILVGFIARLFGRLLSFLSSVLFPEPAEEAVDVIPTLQPKE